MLFFLFFTDGLSTDTYVDSQFYFFLKLNNSFSNYPNLAYNLTQLGDAIVVYPFVLIFLFTAPKLWEALLTSSVITLFMSAALKVMFSIPRPAAIYDENMFIVLGKTLNGHTSLPSGHSMTAFMVITILLYGFLPTKKWNRIFWSVILVVIGLTIGLSRVAVGAHYPLDVIIGCFLGYLSAVIGIHINKNLNWLNRINNRKFYPIIILIFLFWAYLVLLKIINFNLIIFYLALIALIINLFIISYKYVKKNKT